MRIGVVSGSVLCLHVQEFDIYISVDGDGRRTGNWEGKWHGCQLML